MRSFTVTHDSVPPLTVLQCCWCARLRTRARVCLPLRLASAWALSSLSSRPYVPPFFLSSLLPSFSPCEQRLHRGAIEGANHTAHCESECDAESRPLGRTNTDTDVESKRATDCGTERCTESRANSKSITRSHCGPERFTHAYAHYATEWSTYSGAIGVAHSHSNGAAVRVSYSRTIGRTDADSHCCTNCGADQFSVRRTDVGADAATKRRPDVPADCGSDLRLWMLTGRKVQVRPNEWDLLLRQRRMRRQAMWVHRRQGVRRRGLRDVHKCAYNGAVNAHADVCSADSSADAAYRSANLLGALR